MVELTLIMKLLTNHNVSVYTFENVSQGALEFETANCVYEIC